MLPLNGCASQASFTDRSGTGASRTITGPSGAAPAQYDIPCMRIRAGQMVTFTEGSFAQHPLAAAGGDSPNPIPTTSSGTSVDVTFPAAGLFGFHCMIHPTIMMGAIMVTP
jgi:plastocyanin